MLLLIDFVLDDLPRQVFQGLLYLHHVSLHEPLKYNELVGTEHKVPEEQLEQPLKNVQ